MSKQVNITENDIIKLVTESVKKFIKEDIYNVWKPITRPTSPLESFAMRDGWEKMEREDDEPLYRDQDYNEYVVDDYGRRFIPVENVYDDEDYSEIAETKQLRNIIRRMVKEAFDMSYGAPAGIEQPRPAGGVNTNTNEKLDSAHDIRKKIRQWAKAHEKEHGKEKSGGRMNKSKRSLVIT